MRCQEKVYPVLVSDTLRANHSEIWKVYFVQHHHPVDLISTSYYANERVDFFSPNLMQFQVAGD